MPYSSTVAVEASILSNLALNDVWPLRDKRGGGLVKRSLLFYLSRTLEAAVNVATVAALTALKAEPIDSNAVGIALGVAANYATSDGVVWRG